MDETGDARSALHRPDRGRRPGRFHHRAPAAEPPHHALPNVAITPHNAGITPEALEAGLRMSVENIWDFLAGRPSHVVIA